MFLFKYELNVLYAYTSLSRLSFLFIQSKWINENTYANIESDTRYLLLEYFTDEWNSEVGKKKDIPVRFDVSGKLRNKDFHVIFDYYLFEYYSIFSFEEGNDAFEVRNKKKNIYYYRTRRQIRCLIIKDGKLKKEISFFDGQIFDSIRTIILVDFIKVRKY